MNFLKNVEGSKERNIELVMKNEIRDMAILDRIKDIDSEKENNNGCLPHQYISNLITKTEPIFPWIACHLLNSYYRLLKPNQTQNSE